MACEAQETALSAPSNRGSPDDIHDRSTLDFKGCFCYAYFDVVDEPRFLSPLLVVACIEDEVASQTAILLIKGLTLKAQEENKTKIV